MMPVEIRRSTKITMVNVVLPRIFRLCVQRALRTGPPVRFRFSDFFGNIGKPAPITIAACNRASANLREKSEGRGVFLRMGVLRFMLKPLLAVRLLICLSLALSASLILSSCDFQPKGSTLFIIQGKTEYDRATLAFPESDEQRQPLKLRWVDTNTYITTATLTPGKYLFSARTSDGLHYGQEVEITAGQNRYTLPEKSSGATRVSQGPPVLATVTVARGERPTQIAVLFIGSDLTVRRVTSPPDGKISVNAPSPGTWRVEVHGLGQPPRSFVRDGLRIAGPVDLGRITLH